MKSEALKFKAAAHKALQDNTLQPALQRFVKGFPLLRRQAIGQFPDFEKARSEAAAIKDKSLDNLEALHETFRENIEARGGTVIRCKTGAEAATRIAEICHKQGARLVTKAKSMVSEEIALNQALEAENLEVVETDLGEYIVQLAGEPPSHIVGPALHKSKEDVAKLFRKHHRRKTPAETGQQLVAEAREVLRGKYFAAEVAITGANFLIADPGAAVIITNEGNADLCRNLAKTHIVVTSIEKVIPSLKELPVFLRLLGRSASGQPMTAYTTLVTGSRAKGEREGPESFFVVVVDNGRSKLLGTGRQELLRCIKCGACMNTCPVYGAVGGHAYGWVYPGPIGAALNPVLQSPSEMRHLYQATTFCGACEEVCPVKIPLVSMFRHWRAEAYRKRYSGWRERMGLRLWRRIAARPGLYRLAARTAPALVRLLAGRKGYLARLPLASGWTTGRVMPAPERRRK